MEKKNFWSVLLTLGLTLSMGLCFVACGDDDPKPNSEPDPTPIDNPEVEPANEVWEANRQKAYMEQVGLDVNEKISVEDFRHYIKLAHYIDDTYIDGDYEWDDVEDWSEDIFDRLKQSLGKTKTKDAGTWQSDNGYYDEDWNWHSVTWRYVYYDVYTYYRSVVMASNFIGHWTAKNGKWVYSEAKDLQFIFNNESGQQCVLKLETSGKVTKVNVTEYDDWVRYEDKVDESAHTTISNDYYDRVELTIGVPEKILVTFTEGGTTLLTQTIETDISSLSGDDFDLSKSSLGFVSNTVLNNGYTIDVKNVKYTPSSFSLETTMKKNSETLLKVTLSSDLKNVPKQTLMTWYDMDDDEIEDVLTTTTATAAFSVDALGEVQLKGKITDLHKLIDDLDDAEDNEENETRYKRAINNANARYEAFVYYNGGTAKQAWMSLEPFEEKNYWDSYSYWDCEPVINFADGTTYSFENYFTEKNFKSLVDAFDEQGDIAEDIWDN